MKIAGTTIAIILICTTVGCAPIQHRYMNYGASQQQFLKDRYECYNETSRRVSSAYVDQYGGSSSSRVMPSCSAFFGCLAARGYIKADNGNLVVPDGAVLQCQP